MKKENKIIVALTSYPKRICIVHKVIKSLWKQSIKADEIILYLSLIEFPHKEKNLPQELCSMMGKNGFRIEWVEGNLKSHKKYFYALQKYCDDVVITVDDDVEYASTLIQDLMESYQKYPQAVSARRARIVLRDKKRLISYHEWDNYYGECIENPREDVCAIGVGGVLYPPRCASERWFEQDKLLCLAENQDDLWLKYNEILDRIPVAYVKPGREDFSIESANETALGIMNLYSGENDKSINKICDEMKQHVPGIFDAWFDGLATKEEYILEKRGRYCSYIKEVLKERKDRPIYLYGAGKRAETILRILADNQMLSEIEAVLVSDRQNNPKQILGIEVKQLDEIDKMKPIYVMYGVGRKYQVEVEKMLADCDCIGFRLELDGIIQYYEK